MRRSRWAAATGLGSLVLLLAACGGSSNSAAGGSASGAPSASSGSAPAASSATSVSTSSAASQGGGSTAVPKTKSTPHQSVGPQPSGPSDERSIPPIGTTVMIVQKSAIGFVMAEANHAVVYTYDKDTAGQPPTCTGTCAQTWLPATGTPQAGPADHFPGQFGLIKRADGTEQITYEGKPLYTLAGAKPLLTTGNGQGGVWHVVKLSASDIG